MIEKCYGKYRGIVTNNLDPDQLGRIQVEVPDVLQRTPSTWALPSLPVSGMQMGFFTVPPKQAGVWVEFEQGNPDYPIWSGGYWGSQREVPSLARTVPQKVPAITLQTQGGNGIIISDVSGPEGGIVIKAATGASIIVNDTGIYISNGKGASIKLEGQKVDINREALTIE